MDAGTRKQASNGFDDEVEQATIPYNQRLVESSAWYTLLIKHDGIMARGHVKEITYIQQFF